MVTYVKKLVDGRRLAVLVAGSYEATGTGQQTLVLSTLPLAIVLCCFAPEAANMSRAQTHHQQEFVGISK